MLALSDRSDWLFVLVLFYNLDVSLGLVRGVGWLNYAQHVGTPGSVFASDYCQPDMHSFANAIQKSKALDVGLLLFGFELNHPLLTVLA